jgi:hypothetical protein
MLITIELVERSRPISGWLRHGNEPPREFQGMIELISLLDAAWERVGESRGPSEGGSGLSDQFPAGPGRM